MSAWLKKYWPAIVLSIAIVLILDGTISSLATCHPTSGSASSSKYRNEKCTLLQGPFASLIIGLGDFFETHDKGIVAAFTVILAVSTIGLWIATINLYKSGEKQIGSSRQVATIQARQARQQFKFTKETADRQAEEIEAQLKIAGDNAKAAQKAADAAVAAERARFYAIVDHNFLECINRAAAWGGPLDQEERALPMDAQPMAGITFKNYGKTPGFVVDVSTGIVYSETIPTPVFDEKVIMENIISPGESTEKFGTLISGLLNMTQAKKVREGEGTIWVFGTIGYDDVFGERQRHNFFQRLARISQFRYVLQAYDHEHYNRSS